MSLQLCSFLLTFVELISLHFYFVLFCLSLNFALVQFISSLHFCFVVHNSNELIHFYFVLFLPLLFC